MTSKQVKAWMLGSALLAACAQGTEGAGGQFGNSPDGGDPINEGDGSIAFDGDPDEGDGEDDGTPGDGLSGDGATGDGATGDGTTGDGEPGLPDAGAGDGDPGDGSPSDGDPGDGDGDGDPDEPMCPATSGCNAATLLSDFNGDASQADLVTQGSGSQWFNINIVESSSTPFVGLSVLFELSGLADSNYDLYVHESCADTSPDSSTNLGAAVDRVEQSWGDTLISDDSRRLLVEVRHAGGQCSAWTLTAKRP